MKTLLSSKRFSRRQLLVVILVVAAVGGILIFKTFASSFNSADEAVQYNGINFTRASLRLNPVTATTCLNTIARTWSAHMAAANNLYHNANVAAQVTAGCSHNWGWIGENIGLRTGCTAPVTDGCSQNIFTAFIHSPEHYANITSPLPNFVGVGVYRDSHNQIWITQDYMECYCAPATYKPIGWNLTSVETISAAGAARASNITAKRGQVVTYYTDIVNHGPNTATFSRSITGYHYNSAGTLVSSSKTDIGTTTIGNGQIYVYHYNGTIPATAPSRERYCTAIFYTLAGGPGSASSNSNKSCVTVQ